jgi:hypothetical protein
MMTRKGVNTVGAVFVFLSLLLVLGAAAGETYGEASEDMRQASFRPELQSFCTLPLLPAWPVSLSARSLINFDIGRQVAAGIGKRSRYTVTQSAGGEPGAALRTHVEKGL